MIVCIKYPSLYQPTQQTCETHLLLTYHRINAKKEQHNKEGQSPEVGRRHHRDCCWVCYEGQPRPSVGYLTHGHPGPLSRETKN